MDRARRRMHVIRVSDTSRQGAALVGKHAKHTWGHVASSPCHDSAFSPATVPTMILPKVCMFFSTMTRGRSSSSSSSWPNAYACAREREEITPREQVRGEPDQRGYR